MITPAEVRSEIDRLADALRTSGLTLDSNPTVVRTLGGDSIVSWAGSTPGGAPLYSAPTIAEYRRLVGERQFSILLVDSSMLQVSYVVTGGEIVKHRLCYYPCPIEIEPEDLLDLGIADYVELLSVADILSTVRLESPLRFDYDRAAASAVHPASHLTVSRDCCRIPVFAPLSLGHFVRFVFSRFYPALWASHSFLSTWPLAVHRRSIEADHEFHLHLACRHES